MQHSLNELYKRSRQKFAERYDAQEASAVAFALLEDLYGVSRTEVLLDKPVALSDDEILDFEEKVRQIASGVPLQHATGRAPFCGRYFKVTPDTLIPRPETEGIVEIGSLKTSVAPPAPRAGGVVTTFSDESSTDGHSAPSVRGAGRGAFRVLDCGTGSGCIAITVALEHPEWHVEAWDISQGALAVARENAESLGAENVTFLHRDILAEAQRCSQSARAAASAPSAPEAEGLDLLISNPPYICNKEAAEMEAHVLDHEPHTALFVPDDDPLLFYRALAEIGRARLVAGGAIAVECNRAYTEETAALFVDYGFVDVEIVDDCFGAPRFVCGRKAVL